jgi:hypothetical protein
MQGLATSVRVYQNCPFSSGFIYLLVIRILNLLNPCPNGAVPRFQRDSQLVCQEVEVEWTLLTDLRICKSMCGELAVSHAYRRNAPRFGAQTTQILGQSCSRGLLLACSKASLTETWPVMVNRLWPRGGGMYSGST